MGGADGKIYSKGFEPLVDTINIKIGSRKIVENGEIVDNNYFSDSLDYNKIASFGENEERTGLALSNCQLKPEETLTLTFKAKITSTSFGESVKNTVVAYGAETEQMEITRAEIKVNVEKKIKINPNGEETVDSDTNIILVVDTSWSITNRNDLKKVVYELINQNNSLYGGSR